MLNDRLPMQIKQSTSTSSTVLYFAIRGKNVNTPSIYPLSGACEGGGEGPGAKPLYPSVF